MPPHNLSPIFMGMKGKKIKIRIENWRLEIGDFKKCNFFKSTNFEKIIRLKACKSGKIEAKDIDVAQPIWFSGCPVKCHFNAKSTKMHL